MSDPAQGAADRPAKEVPFQFGIKHLFGLTFLMAVFLSTLVGLYPFSLMMLPLVLFAFVAAVLWGFFVHVAFGWKSPTLPEALVVCVIMYPLVSFLASGCVDLSGPWRRMECSNHLKEIALALHNYHDSYGCPPPAYVADEQGRPMHSWRVLILPFLDHGDIYAQYNFDEPWDGHSNRSLLNMNVPSVFQCPEDTASPTATSYVVVVGPETMWPGSTSVQFADIADGTSYTLMVVEVANSGIHWMEPRDLDFADLPMSVNPESGGGISSLHREQAWLPKRPYGANFAMADGCVQMLATDLPPETLRALLVTDDHQPVLGWDRVRQ
jgi:hypothetical protein